MFNIKAKVPKGECTMAHRTGKDLVSPNAHSLLFI